MRTISACIVDDDAQSIKSLKKFLSDYCDWVNIDYTSTNPTDALKVLRKDLFDLYFIDVNMPGLSGFELLDILGKEICQKTIIITGYSQNVIKALRHGVHNLLEKPIQIEDLVRAMTRFMEHLDSNDAEFGKEKINIHRLLINRHDRSFLVDPDEIVYIEAKGPYTILHFTNQKSIQVTKPLAVVINECPASFLQVSRSYYVNFFHFKELVKTKDSGILVLTNDITVTISLSLRSRFLRLIEDTIGINTPKHKR